MLTAHAESPDLSEQDEPTVTTTELVLGGMHCSACATRIQRSLDPAAGRGQRFGQSGHHSCLRLLRPRKR